MLDRPNVLKALSFNTNVPLEVRALAEAVSGLSASVDGSQSGHKELFGRIAQIEGRLVRLEQELVETRSQSRDR